MLEAIKLYENELIILKRIIGVRLQYLKLFNWVQRDELWLVLKCYVQTFFYKSYTIYIYMWCVCVCVCEQ